jgi:hypothetical protein
MIKITNATIYSTKGEMAYQIEYSDGTIIRAVESNKIIRNEFKTATGWKHAGKAYKVDHSKTRQAERVKAEVIKFCN